jgi:hypothetical protein
MSNDLTNWKSLLVINPTVPGWAHFHLCVILPDYPMWFHEIKDGGSRVVNKGLPICCGTVDDL